MDKERKREKLRERQRKHFTAGSVKIKVPLLPRKQGRMDHLFSVLTVLMEARPWFQLDKCL